MHNSTFLKSDKPNIWDSSDIRKTSRSSQKMKIRQKSQSVINNEKDTQKKLISQIRSSKYYSIKYLGVTKGQIGVLSKRTKIPELSPMETCKDVPLSVINNCMCSTTKEDLPSKMKANSRESSPTRRGKLEADDFVVHTYARPRGLSVSRRTSNKPKLESRTLATPIQTTSVSGWKLKRPRTNSPSKLRPQGETDKNKFLQVYSKGYETTGYAEPYLKYLVRNKTQGR